MRKRYLPFVLAVVACLALATAAVAQPRIGQGRALTVEATPQRATSSGLIASQAACPGQRDLSAPAATQEEAMRCLTNFARGRRGLSPLADTAELDLSASAKADDLLACDTFSHTACGRDFTYWMREVGYISESCWHVGENLAWGSGEYGTVRSIFQAWMRSPTHRRNILGDYSQIGISLERGDLQGQDAHVWAQHFGSRCEQTAS